MKRFQRILVAVDLTSGDELVSDELVPPSAEAVNQAILAQQFNSLADPNIIPDRPIFRRANRLLLGGAGAVVSAGVAEA